MMSRLITCGEGRTIKIPNDYVLVQGDISDVSECLYINPEMDTWAKVPDIYKFPVHVDIAAQHGIYLCRKFESIPEFSDFTATPEACKEVSESLLAIWKVKAISGIRTLTEIRTIRPEMLQVAVDSLHAAIAAYEAEPGGKITVLYDEGDLVPLFRFDGPDDLVEATDLDDEITGDDASLEECERLLIQKMLDVKTQLDDLVSDVKAVKALDRELRLDAVVDAVLMTILAAVSIHVQWRYMPTSWFLGYLVIDLLGLASYGAWFKTRYEL